MRRGWPLVGRSDELAVVLGALQNDASGGIVVAGPPGVGRTRLARDAVAALEPSRVVEWVTVTSAAASVPFGGFSLALRYIDPSMSNDAAGLLQRTANALVAKAEGKPLVVAVDDGQWLDSASIALVHHLVTTGLASLLITVRTGEAPTDPFMGLWKDGVVERLELKPLSRPESDALVELALELPTDSQTLRRLWDLSRGNPLFLREVLASGAETSAIVVRDGICSWRDPLNLSTRLIAILEDRLTRVSVDGRAILNCLALGEPLPFDVLTELGDAAGIVEVERAGLAVIDPSESHIARLTHPLYGEVLRSAMSTVERRILADRLADAVLAHSTGSRTDMLRIATWRLESGTAAGAPLLTEAAQIASAAFDHHLAERLARRAIEEGGGLPAALALGIALNQQGQYFEGERVLAPLARTASTDRDRVDVAVARYYGFTVQAGFLPEFEDVLLDAERRVSDPQLLGFLRAQRATLLAFAGHLSDAISLAKVTTDEASALRAVPALGNAWTCLGKIESARALADHNLPIAIRHRDDLPQAAFWVVSTHLSALLAGSLVDDADRLIALVESQMGTAPADPDAVDFLAFVRGVVALARGRPNSAQRWLREGLAGMRDATKWRAPLLLAYLAEASALRGDGDSAATAVAAAEAQMGGFRIVEGMVRRARAWAALAHGQRRAAAQLAVEAAAWSREHDQYSAAVLALHDALRFGAGRGAGSALLELAPKIEGPFASCVANHARGVLTDDPDVLDAASSQFEALGLLLLAAEAAGQAADRYRQAGMLGKRDRAQARAAVLMGACEDARSPVMEDLAHPVALTPREREVARLAADGLSSPAIAERLFVAPRTVEGHLYRLYAKLGVTDRDSLARLLRSTKPKGD